jgi:hypothetical protein
VIKTIGRVSIACVLLSAVEAHAIPLTFEFAAQVQSYGTLNGGLPVPAQFTDSSFVFNAPVSGAFTIETDTPAGSSYTYLNGVLTEVGSYYSNSVTQGALSIGDQQFNFLSSVPPGSYDDYQSGVSVTNLPVPSNDPWVNYDGVDLDINFGTGVFAGPYSHLSATLSLIRSEHDLSVISSRGLADSLVPSPNWNAFFTIYDTALPNQNYQIWARVTSFTQTASVPEPGTSALLALGLVLTVSGVSRRKRTS